MPDFAGFRNPVDRIYPGFGARLAHAMGPGLPLIILAIQVHRNLEGMMDFIVRHPDCLSNLFHGID